jgi:hypothetical protein
VTAAELLRAIWSRIPSSELRSWLLEFEFNELCAYVGSGPAKEAEVDRTIPTVLTVVIRNTAPLRFMNEPIAYRTVRLVLTSEQRRALHMDENEDVNLAILETKHPPEAL